MASPRKADRTNQNGGMSSSICRIFGRSKGIEPVGFPHPFQIEDVVQRGQCHPAFCSCQFCYPLPFRGQVCKTQSSLPCCPSAVLSSRRPLSSIGSRRDQFPDVVSTMRALRLPTHAFPVTYLFRSRGPRDSSSVRARRCQRSRAGGGLATVSNYRRSFTWTRVGPLRFPGDPSCAFAPVQDPGRTDAPSPITVASGAAPAVGTAKAPAC